MITNKKSLKIISKIVLGITVKSKIEGDHCESLTIDH